MPPPIGEEPVRSTELTHLARSGMLQIAAALGQAFLPVYQILVARLFGAEAQGIYAYALASIDVLGRTGLMGSDKGLMRYVAAYRADGSSTKLAQAISAALRLCVPIALVLTVAVVIGAGTIARTTELNSAAFVVRAMAPTIVCHALVLTLVAATLGARTSEVHLWVRGVLQPGLLILGALVAYGSGTGLHGLAVAHTSVFVVLVGFSLWGAFRVFGTKVMTDGLRRRGLPGFRRFAFPIGMSEMTNAILQRADILILGAFVDAKSIAFYCGAEQLTRSVGGIRYAFDGIAAPLLAEAYHRNERERLQHNLALLTRWVALGAAPIAAIVFSLRHELLALFGPDYPSAAMAMALLLLAQVVNSIIGLTPHALVMGGRSDLFMWTNLAAAIVNVVLNLILIPQYGLVGAAAAALCGVTTLQLALAVQTWLLLHVHPLSWGLVKALVASVLVGVFAAWVRASMNVPVWALVAIVVVGGAIIYGFALLVLGLDPDDRKLLQGFLARLRRKRSG